jgi:hypothetical protein
MSLVWAYRRLAVLCPVLRLTVTPAGFGDGAGDGPCWIDAAALARDPAALDAFLAAEAARIRQAYGVEAREDVVATRALHSYLWSAGLLMSGPLYLERRVPLLRPQDIRVGPGGSLRVTPGRFACLPDDPAAASPRATVLDSDEDMHAELRRVVADHVRPLLATLRPRLRRGTRALWGMAGDDLVSGLWHLGRALGEEQHGAGLATRLLPVPFPPFPGGAHFRPAPDALAGEPQLTRTRIGCCLHYTVRPDETCSTCPRRTCATAPAEAVVPAGLVVASAR